MNDKGSFKKIKCMKTGKSISLKTLADKMNEVIDYINECEHGRVINEIIDEEFDKYMVII